MQGNTAFAGTADAAAPATVQQCATPVEKYTDEQVRQFVIALEDPFDPREIKWRVTNTTADRRRGQVIAYADPRAYTDRLNALFTVRGWTREYTVQVIQNFERKERGNGDGIISGKIVVTCRVTIDGMGSHSGLGEEWADNENAGTSAESPGVQARLLLFWIGTISLRSGWQLGRFGRAEAATLQATATRLGSPKAEAGRKWTSEWSRQSERQRAPEVGGSFSSGARRTPDKGEVPL